MKFICTSPLNATQEPSCRWENITDDGYIGDTPIEDFGMFLVLDEEISSKSASRLFIALLGHQEGEEPEVKDEITRDDELYRPVYMPQLLTPDDFKIYQKLISC